jgi:hypothetical protein
MCSEILAPQSRERRGALLVDNFQHDPPRPYPVQLDEKHGLLRA